MITLKTLESTTPQEVFNQVAKHLLSQNTTSYKKDGETCAYRGAYGAKCAAGCLIADDEYSDVMDRGNETGSYSWDSMVRNGFAPNVHVNLIVSLQRVHDNILPLQWRRSLLSVAKEYGLSTAAID